MLSPGQPVNIQSEKDKTWAKEGTVVEIRPDKLSYLVDCDGLVSLRSRAMLRPKVSRDFVQDSEGQVQDHVSGGVPALKTPPILPPSSPRRSVRLQDQKEKEKIKCVVQATQMSVMPSKSGEPTITHIRMNPMQDYQPKCWGILPL